MIKSWTWATADPQERGMWVRENFTKSCMADIDRLCSLFLLTKDGAQKILDGDIWRPEYEQPTINEI